MKKAKPEIEKIYPSDNLNELEMLIEKYITRDLLGTMLIFELLKTKKNDAIFTKWLKDNDKHMEFEDVLPFIIDLRIKDTNFSSEDYILNEKLFSLAKDKDPKHYLNDSQIGYLTMITRNNNLEEKIIKYLSDKENDKLFHDNDLRWLVFNLIMSDDESLD